MINMNKITENERLKELLKKINEGAEIGRASCRERV